VERRAWPRLTVNVGLYYFEKPVDLQKRDTCRKTKKSMPANLKEPESSETRVRGWRYQVFKDNGRP